jgi:hypothetical protein
MNGVLAWLPVFFATVIVTACNDSSRVAKDGTGQEAVYSDYRIEGEEGKEKVTCLFQFRLGGPNGPAFLLNEPRAIELDGEAVHPDSTRLSGVYYELTRPVSEFKGKHALVFTDEQGKRHRQEFEFWPFSLATEIPSKVKRAPFAIQLTNFPKNSTPVQLIMVDTAFETNDVNEMAVVNKGQLLISEPLLSRLKSGPVLMELIKEEEKSIKKGSRWKGRLVISYELKREFELVDK